VQFIRVRFPVELSAYRSNRNRVTLALVVMVDGDKTGVTGRIKALAAVCEPQGMKPREDDEHVLIFVPTWNIE
jgi:hypothetical protein